MPVVPTTALLFIILYFFKEKYNFYNLIEGLLYFRENGLRARDILVISA